MRENVQIDQFSCDTSTQEALATLPACYHSLRVTTFNKPAI